MQNRINEEPARLTVTFDNRNPVELGDLTLSLLALADEYKRFAGRQIGSAAADDVKLYVNQLRKGSIMVELAPIVALAVPALTPYLPLLNKDSGAIVQFGEYLDKAYHFLLGEKTKPGGELEKANYKNLATFVEPVAKDPGSKVSVNISLDGAVINAPVQIDLSSMQANAIQNQAQREIERLGQSASGIFPNVLLYWHQTKNDLKSATGDKAIIERISPGPVKVSFAYPGIKAAMIRGDQNPYKTAYLVDVDVQDVRGRPALYHILALHDTIDLGDSDQLQHPELM